MLNPKADLEQKKDAIYRMKHPMVYNKNHHEKNDVQLLTILG